MNTAVAMHVTKAEAYVHLRMTAHEGSACRTFLLNRERAVDYLNMLDRLYVFDGYAGWDPKVSVTHAGSHAGSMVSYVLDIGNHAASLSEQVICKPISMLSMLHMQTLHAYMICQQHDSPA